MAKVVSQKTDRRFSQIAISVFGRIALFGFLGWSSAVSAQEQNHISARQIVVGELLGRTDMRQLKLLTPAGEVSIFGAEPEKPFEVTTVSETEILITLDKTPEMRPYNPVSVLFKFYESERAMISALILDEADVAELENESSALEVAESNPDFLPLPVIYFTNTVKLLCYNHRNPLLSSATVRIALSQGIDHGRIKGRILDNKATIARGPFDDDSPLYNSGMEDYNYEPRQAVQLLGSEGWRDSDRDGILDRAGEPFSINLYYPKGLRIDDAIARQIKINLLEIGIQVKPRPLNKSEINDELKAGTYDVVLMDHTFQDNLESLEDFFAPEGAHNYMSYNSNRIERHVRFYKESRDEKAKRTLIRSIQKIINEDQPVTFLYFKWNTHHMINREKLGNFRDSSGRIRPFSEWIINSLHR